MNHVRAISFDLTGTLLGFTPSLGTMCADAMRELGIDERKIPAPKTFDARRKQAQRTARANGFSPTSDARSREYWRSMLWEIFAGNVPTELFPGALDIIYRRIADARSWRALPHAAAALDAARFLGLRCVALSNGDSRWRNALEKLGLAPFFEKIFLSAETGLAKPDAKAFDNVCFALKIRRDELVHVGDSLATDVLPAQALGINAVWFMNVVDDAPRTPERIVAIESLAELPELLRSRLCADAVRTHFPRRTRNLLALLRGVPEEQTPLAATIVAKKGGSESLAKKRERVEEAPFTVEREFVVPAERMEKILSARGIFRGSMQSLINENWPNLVPEELASRCAPVELRAGLTTLVVACESAVIRQQLEFKKRILLKKIRALRGCDRIKKIVFSNEIA